LWGVTNSSIWEEVLRVEIGV